MRRPSPAALAARRPGGKTAALSLLEVLGRLPAGTTLARVEATLTALISRGRIRPPVRPAFVRELLVKNVRRVLLTMWVMTGLVMVSPVSTSPNLLTARATARQQELAVRVSLGGRRLRLARQLVVEALVLVAIGGAIGLFLAHFGAGTPRRRAAAASPWESAGVTIDGRIMGFAAD